MLQRRAETRRGLLGMGCCSLLAACQALSGVDDLVFEDDAGLGGAAAQSGSGGSGGTSTGGGPVVGGASGSSGAGGASGESGSSGFAGTSGSGGASGSAGTGGAPPCGANQVCVPNVPTGWLGPVRVWEGGATAEPKCSTYSWSPVLTSGEHWFEPSVTMVTAHTCFTCSCGPVTGGDCNADLQFSSTSACADNLHTEYVSFSGCVSQPAQNNWAYAKITNLTPKNAKCTPSQSGSANIPPPVGNAAVACAMTPGAACEAGKSCIDAKTSVFTSVCIYSSTQSTCPNAYPTKHSYNKWNDTRFCTACGCGTPAVQSCANTTVGVWTGGCSSAATPVNVGTTCTSLGTAGASSVNIQKNLSYGSGPCAITGGVATGSATITDTVTVCCL